MNRGWWRGAVVVGVLLMAAPAAAGEQWEKVVDGPVTVRVREVAGGVKEVWAEAEFSATVADVQATLTEPERFPAFMPHLKEAQTLDKSGNVSHVYQYVEPPVVGSRDYVTEVTNLELVTPDGRGNFHQVWKAQQGMRAERKGTVRIKVNEGSWVVKPLPNGRSKVVYRFKTDPGGWVPAFIAQMATAKAVPETLRAVEREAQRRSETRVAASPAPAEQPGSAAGTGGAGSAGQK
jgi:hypothetical protein